MAVIGAGSWGTAIASMVSVNAQTMLWARSAVEVIAGRPAASVVAMADQAAAIEMQGLFSTPTFRVYTNPDVVGCEVAGALENVVAIAAGMCDGMSLGDSTKAALMTRGLAELARLGVALGGRPLTFGGLAGMGDLMGREAKAELDGIAPGYEV